MKTSEAIASLKTLCNTCTMFPKCVNNKPECFQAIEKAISALEKQENVCEKCEYNIIDDDELPCCDCIRLGNKGGREDYYEPYTEEEA